MTKKSSQGVTLVGDAGWHAPRSQPICDLEASWRPKWLLDIIINSKNSKLSSNQNTTPPMTKWSEPSTTMQSCNPRFSCVDQQPETRVAVAESLAWRATQRDSNSLVICCLQVARCQLPSLAQRIPKSTRELVLSYTLRGHNMQCRSLPCCPYHLAHHAVLHAVLGVSTELSPELYASKTA